jgi:hypothetical protein
MNFHFHDGGSGLSALMTLRLLTRFPAKLGMEIGRRFKKSKGSGKGKRIQPAADHHSVPESALWPAKDY